MDNVLCRSCRVRRSIKQVARARGNSMKRTPDRCLFPVDRTTRGNSKNEERQRADALVTIMKTTGSRGINCESRPRGRKRGMDPLWKLPLMMMTTVTMMMIPVIRKLKMRNFVRPCVSLVGFFNFRGTVACRNFALDLPAEWRPVSPTCRVFYVHLLLDTKRGSVEWEKLRVKTETDKTK